MNKLLKLTGISMLAMLAASNANAAGYTCEELIEYTSCNTGYYLNNGDCIAGSTCGAGNYLKAVCPEIEDEFVTLSYSDAWCHTSDDIWYEATSRDSCESNDGTWYGPGCSDSDSGPGHFAASYICTACSAGSYQPSAGQYSCITCPAGSYCGTTGLSAVSGVCADGTYASVGSTQCTNCLQTGLTDVNGNTVVATTGGTGGDSLAACYISPDTYFKNDKGIYHYKSNCRMDYYYKGLDSDWVCEPGYVYMDDINAPDMNVDLVGCYRIPDPKTEEECLDLGGLTEWDSSTQTCNCLATWVAQSGSMRCD